MTTVRMAWVALVAALAVAATVAPVALTAADLSTAHALGGDGASPPIPQTAPPAADTPTVAVSFYVVDVRRIDDAAQRIGVDFAFWLSWTDPSLADPTATGTRYFAPTDAWVPDLQIVNGLTLENRRPPQVEVQPDGTALFRRRFVGDLTLPMDFSDFPRDRHDVRIQAVNPDQRNPVRLVIDETLTGQQDRFTVADWEVGEGRAGLFRFTPLGQDMAGAYYELPMRRYVSYYVWKILVPLSTVVFMSWTVFWIDPRQVAPQIGIAATSILTLIAYRFTLGFLVPRLSYFTRLDVFIVGSSLLVFGALVEAVVTVNLAAADKLAMARRVDVFARWGFAAAFVGLLLLAFAL